MSNPVPKPWKWGPLQYSCATDMDRTVVFMHNVRLGLWRFRIELSFQTQASVDRIKRQAVYDALRAQAVQAWGDADHVAWAMDDHWADDGTYETAIALLERIVAGTEPNPWAEAETSA
ncbi:hypothetical protein [Sphingobium cloacae]|uniref:Uncharacterized protein n=1 Tax=Sphingobium cloacae TaxID=120107 RepID=A0A1E1F2P7_9SPHN|nr:hypothetical protein [Sphingobium cloacae]BAV64776.1 hypothetical protein SCLO_1017360 [Sphingobium cloacae]